MPGATRPAAAPEVATALHEGIAPGDGVPVRSRVRRFDPPQAQSSRCPLQAPTGSMLAVLLRLMVGDPESADGGLMNAIPRRVDGAAQVAAR